VGEERWEDGGLGDRGRCWIMERLGVLPALVGVREYPAIAFYALSGRLACFYCEADGGPSVTVVAAGRGQKVAVLGRVDPAELERAVIDCAELDADEASWVLADLRAARAAP